MDNSGGWCKRMQLDSRKKDEKLFLKVHGNVSNFKNFSPAVGAYRRLPQAPFLFSSTD